MDSAPLPDPNDWRTWRRDGIRIFPPAGTTDAQTMAGMMEFSAARWGVGPSRPGKERRYVTRVMKKIDGRYKQIQFARSTDRGLVHVRVYGGCRLSPSFG